MSLTVGEIVAIVIVVLVLVAASVFLCYKCWCSMAELNEDMNKPRNSFGRNLRNSIRRSFRSSLRRMGSLRGRSRRGPAPVVPPRGEQLDEIVQGRSQIHPRYLPEGQSKVTQGREAPPSYKDSLHHQKVEGGVVNPGLYTIDSSELNRFSTQAAFASSQPNGSEGLGTYQNQGYIEGGVRGASQGYPHNFSPGAQSIPQVPSNSPSHNNDYSAQYQTGIANQRHPQRGFPTTPFGHLYVENQAPSGGIEGHQGHEDPRDFTNHSHTSQQSWHEHYSVSPGPRHVGSAESHYTGNDAGDHKLEQGHYPAPPSGERAYFNAFDDHVNVATNDKIQLVSHTYI